MAVLATVKVGRDFRVTIPKEARELLKLEEGDELVFFKTEGARAYLQPADDACKRTRRALIMVIS